MVVEDEIIEQVILGCGNVFDSHQVIAKFIQQNQRLYVSLLAATESDQPFQALHSRLGKQIKVICERHGLQGESFNSPDIFGNVRSCHKWSMPMQESA